MGVCMASRSMSLPSPLPGGPFDLLESLPGCKDPALPCLLVAGHHTRQKQEDFAPKLMKRRGHRGFEELGQTVGFVCRKGRKPGNSCPYNQDDFAITQVGGTAVYGVFDGHGEEGHAVSTYVASRILHNLTRDPVVGSDLARALHNAFVRTHRDCELLYQKQQLSCNLSGTTATLLVDRRAEGGGARELCVAHVGDSRAVLGYRAGGPGGAELLARDLTTDHKPELTAERTRIYIAGGAVRQARGETGRVYMRDRDYPGLAMSRSIGDLIAASVGVVSEPDVKMLRMEEGWRFVLICSDGVWDFVTSQEAVDIVGGHPPSEVQAAVEELAATARERWLEEEEEMVDDITALCVWLAP